MSHICNFCNSHFSSLYTLAAHKKNAKFCLALQTTDNIDKKEVHVCNYCDKPFTTKTNLNTHLSTCKSKQEHEKLDSLRTHHKIELDNQRLQYEKELDSLHKEHDNQRLQYEKELDNQRIMYEKELDNQRVMYEKELDNQRLYYERELQLKQSEKVIDMLKEQLSEKKTELSNKNTEIVHIIDKINNHQQNVTITDNSTNNTYSVQFNKMLEDILPYTDENIMKQFGKIPTNELRSDVDKLDVTFISQFNKYMSKLAFCTDPSRGKLVTKNEDGVPVKRLSEHVVLDCLIKCNKQINILINDLHYRIEQDYEIENIDITEKQELDLQHAYLHDHLKTHRSTITPYIRRIAADLSRTCAQLQKT